MATEEDLPVVLPPTYTRQKVYRWPSGETVDDAIADEVPISITYNGISHVVMMASPELLEEFAVGFSLSERIIPDISHIYDIQVKEGCGNGLVVEMEISPLLLQTQRAQTFHGRPHRLRNLRSRKSEGC